jgi:methanogenic corrinoid protein MtbC1
MTASVLRSLVTFLLDGDQAQSLGEVRRLRESGLEALAITTDGVEAAMAELDAKCTVEQFNLLEIMLCGRAAMAVLKELYPPTQPRGPTVATVVVGSLQGDVHDLGKNIFKMVVTASGYGVVDCGKDCPADKLIDAAANAGALAIGVSGLLTTVVPQVRGLKERLTDRGLSAIKVMAGGAALKQASAESLRVDFVARSAFEGLHYLDQLTGRHEQP